MGRMSDTQKKISLKALKIAFGSCLAIVIAELLQLQYATSAGTVMLLTVLDTKKDTIQLAFGRIGSSLLSVGLIFAIFHFPGIPWILFGVYLLIMILLCYNLGWPNTISVNAVMGIHFIQSQDYSPQFVAGELLLIAIGSGIAILLNWRMPSHLKDIKADIEEIERQMKELLEGLGFYMQETRGGDYIWTDLDRLEQHLREGLTRAREEAQNTMDDTYNYYIEYMLMRMKQCDELQALQGSVSRIREMPAQAVFVSEYLMYLANYVQEMNIPKEQVIKLREVYRRMEQEPLPTSHSEFENRAILYHVLMDLDEFLAEKQKFLNLGLKRPGKL